MGSAAKEVRSVSPMPSANNIPKPTADFTAPSAAPPSVLPKCKGCLQLLWPVNDKIQPLKDTSEAFYAYFKLIRS